MVSLYISVCRYRPNKRL